MARSLASDRPLTDKAAKFVAAYVANGGNGKDAAITAGYSAKGAHVEASRMLKSPNIRNAIQAHKAKAEQRAVITAASILQDILEIGNEARQAGDYGAALKSRQLLGESLSDPLFTKAVRRTRAPMTPAERAARLAALAAKAAA
jgi:hypothetical protein